MKTTSKTIGLAAMICLAITFTSCKKEAVIGPKGEIGETGDAGGAGTAGINGAQGKPGEKGSAGLSISSQNFEVATWVYDQITKEYQGYILDNRITQEVLNGGGVQVFIKSADNQYIALPATFYPAPGVSFKTGFSVGQQQVKIQVQYPDLQQGPLPGALTFKIVVFSTEFMDAHKNIDLKNYDEVSKYTGN
jgi:hypothetical protein